MGSDNAENSLPHTSPFEAIREEGEDGSEYWSARDLSKILGYTEWRNFTTAIEKAKEACQNSGQAVSDHFVEANKLIEAGKKARRKIEDYHLSRYACYLLIQNADPSKPIVALGQTYFAVQTRRQELADELAALPEDQLRLLRRAQMTIYNSHLAGAAQQSGVIKALALGARAVLVGRPILWGLAVNGAQGVSHVLEILRKELELAMALSGRPTLAGIDRTLVKM